jgi:hypothetical protein
LAAVVGQVDPGTGYVNDVFSPAMVDGTPRVFIGVFRPPPPNAGAHLIVDMTPGLTCGHHYSPAQYRERWARGEFDRPMYRDPEQVPA